MKEHDAPCGGVKISGAPNLDELKATPGFPGELFYSKGPLAFIECVEEIPCNPCETACPKGAIHVGQDITALPVLDPEACIGCGLCIAACPGLAIFLRDQTYDAHRCLLSFPYEYYPLPEKGRKVTMADRFGRAVCDGEILKVRTSERNDHTAVVSAVYDKKYFLDVVTIIRLKPDSPPAKMS